MKRYLDNSPSTLPTKPTNCHWCMNGLSKLRNIYKGKDSERHYCSDMCLKLGEERALRYVAALAGRVS